MPARATVTVPVTNLWTSPDGVRDVDAAMLRQDPDLSEWLAALDAARDGDDGRLGLDGRLLSQLVAGEPVQLLGGTTPDGRWAEVACTWQPSGGGSGRSGYRGWVVGEHLAPVGSAGDTGSAVGVGARAGTHDSAYVGAHAGAAAADLPAALLGSARRYLGVPYLWGGCCGAALDCSGLVHRSARDLGVVVPRDADDQHDAVLPVPLDEAAPGDLLFFARPGQRPHHVGIASGPGRMLHAPQTGAVVVEEPIGPERAATLVAAGRVAASGGRGAGAWQPR